MLEFGPILKVRSIHPTKTLSSLLLLGTHCHASPSCLAQGREAGGRGLTHTVQKELRLPIVMGLCSWHYLLAVPWPQAWGGSPGNYSRPPGMP